jgi:nitroreductase
MRAALAADPDARQLVRFETLAANSHNAQPWKFHLVPGRIEILPDSFHSYHGKATNCRIWQPFWSPDSVRPTSQFATGIVIETT